MSEIDQVPHHPWLVQMRTTPAEFDALKEEMRGKIPADVVEDLDPDQEIEFLELVLLLQWVRTMSPAVRKERERLRRDYGSQKRKLARRVNDCIDSLKELAAYIAKLEKRFPNHRILRKTEGGAAIEQLIAAEKEVQQLLVFPSSIHPAGQPVTFGEPVIPGEVDDLVRRLETYAIFPKPAAVGWKELAELDDLEKSDKKAWVDRLQSRGVLDSRGVTRTAKQAEQRSSLLLTRWFRHQGLQKNESEFRACRTCRHVFNDKIRCRRLNEAADRQRGSTAISKRDVRERKRLRLQGGQTV